MINQKKKKKKSSCSLTYVHVSQVKVAGGQMVDTSKGNKNQTMTIPLQLLPQCQNNVFWVNLNVRKETMLTCPHPPLGN